MKNIVLKRKQRICLSLGYLTQQIFTSHGSGGYKSKTRVPFWSAALWRLSSCFIDGVCLLTVSSYGREQASEQASKPWYLRKTHPIMGTPPWGTHLNLHNSSQRLCTKCHHSAKLRFQHMSLGEHRHATPNNIIDKTHFIKWTCLYGP